MEWLDEQSTEQTGYSFDHSLAVLYIECTERACDSLRRAIRRMRENVRRSDVIWWVETSCALVLEGTPPEGVQAVAKRISMLLADVDCTLQTVFGETAQELLRRIQAQQAVIVVSDEMQSPPMVGSEQEKHLLASSGDEGSDLPYLAFLAHYPAHRILHLFPYELACRYRCVPVGTERKVLTIATCQRLDEHVVAQLQEITQREIFQVRCEARMIDDVLSYWQRLLLV